MRGPNKPIQTEEEMIQSITEQKRDNRIYKVQADEHRSDQLSSMIHRSSEQLEEAYRHKVRLSDTDAVKEQTMKYLKACEKVGAFPSIIGLSAHWGTPVKQSMRKSTAEKTLTRRIGWRCAGTHFQTF